MRTYYSSPAEVAQLHWLPVRRQVEFKLACLNMDVRTQKYAEIFSKYAKHRVTEMRNMRRKYAEIDRDRIFAYF